MRPRGLGDGGQRPVDLAADECGSPVTRFERLLDGVRDRLRDRLHDGEWVRGRACPPGVLPDGCWSVAAGWAGAAPAGGAADGAVGPLAVCCGGWAGAAPGGGPATAGGAAGAAGATGSPTGPVTGAAAAGGLVTGPLGAATGAGG